jgi:hypothetical protein
MRVSHSPARPRPPPRRTLRSCASNDRDAFRRVTIDQVALAAQAANAFVVECAAQPRAPFSPRSRRLVRQHVGAEYPSASAVSPIRLAVPRASRRAMRRTDFCLLTSSYEHPRLAGSRCVMRLRACAIGEIACLTSVRFASVGRTFSLVVTAVGLLFPSRCVRTGPLTSLSPLPRVSFRSRGMRTRGSRQDRLRLARVNDASRGNAPRCLPSDKDLRPATPSRAPGSGLSRLRGLATAIPVLDAFSPSRPFRVREGRAPVHAPRCQRESRFSEPRRRLPTSAT